MQCSFFFSPKECPLDLQQLRDHLNHNNGEAVFPDARHSLALNSRKNISQRWHQAPFCQTCYRVNKVSFRPHIFCLSTYLHCFPFYVCRFQTLPCLTQGLVLSSLLSGFGGSRFSQKLLWLLFFKETCDNQHYA